MEVKMGTAKDSEHTRTVLIQAAGELFAANGFAGVSARQVATKAGVALSTIPYHFGSMDSLYHEVLLVASEVAPEAQPFAEQALAAEPSEGLRLAIRWIFADFAGQKVAWPVQLLERECLDPSATFREVVHRKFKPEAEWLAAVVGRATSRPAEDEAVQYGVSAMYNLASAMFTRRLLLTELSPAVAERVHHEAFVEVLAGITLDAVARYAAAFTNQPEPKPVRKGKK
jgi:TetR/AcrR family transcriptional regulator, regulator of cefoperazone and chloramphenicol sensitivity